jgi:hypothetical protein
MFRGWLPAWARLQPLTVLTFVFLERYVPLGCDFIVLEAALTELLSAHRLRAAVDATRAVLEDGI